MNCILIFKNNFRMQMNWSLSSQPYFPLSQRMNSIFYILWPTVSPYIINWWPCLGPTLQGLWLWVEVSGRRFDRIHSHLDCLFLRLAWSLDHQCVWYIFTIHSTVPYNSQILSLQNLIFYVIIFSYKLSKKL